jgi:hypothetical protein
MQLDHISNSQQPQSLSTTDNKLKSFQNKAILGMDIEELMILDTKNQRKAANAMKQAQRQQRRAKVQEVVNEMKEAAKNRKLSAWVGAGVQIAAAALSYACAGGVFGKISTHTYNFIDTSSKASAAGYAQYNNFTFDADQATQNTEFLREDQDQISDKLNDTSEWLSSAKELERKMLDRFEQISQTEHNMRMDVWKKMG